MKMKLPHEYIHKRKAEEMRKKSALKQNEGDCRR